METLARRTDSGPTGDSVRAVLHGHIGMVYESNNCKPPLPEMQAKGGLESAVHVAREVAKLAAGSDEVPGLTAGGARSFLRESIGEMTPRGSHPYEGD